MKGKAPYLPHETAEEVSGFSNDPKNFYCHAVERVLIQNITSWFGNCCFQDINGLQRVIRATEHCARSALLSVQDIYTRRCRARASRIIRDSPHPSNCLFLMTKSGKCYRNVLWAKQRDSGGASILGPWDFLTRTCYHNCSYYYRRNSLYLYLIVMLIFNG